MPTISTCRPMRPWPEFDLDRRSFKLLGRLRSFGPPYQRSAGMLANDMQLSSGAMTNRLDRMEAAGLIRRLPTRTIGAARWSSRPRPGMPPGTTTVGTQARREAMIAAVLTDKEREQLHTLLRHLMRAFPDKGHGLKLGDRRRHRGVRRRPRRAQGVTRERAVTDSTPAIEAIERAGIPFDGRPDRAGPQRRGERGSSRASSSRRCCARSSSGAARTTTSSSWSPVAAASTGRRSVPISGSSGCRSPTPMRRTG